MTSRVLVDDDEQIIADLLKQNRVLGTRPSATSVRGYHDEFTAAAPPATAYALTYIPVDGTCQLSINGLVLIEGTDYVPDYTTGVVTVSATQTTGDELTFRYLITDLLVAASMAPETDAATIVQTAIGHVNSGGSGSVTATFGATPTPGNILVMMVSKYAPRAEVPNPAVGWTEAISPADSGNASLDVYTRTVAPGDGTTWQLDEGFGFTDAMSIGLYEITGSDGTPAGWTYATQAATASPVSQSVTETAGQLLLVACVFHAGSSSGPLTTITPSGYAEDRHVIGDYDSLIIGHETATGSAQSIGTSWDGTDGDAVQIVVAVPPN